MLFLVGFMGTGKSSVGRAVAERSGWRFVDLDALIERDLGMTVMECFTVLGEGAFREAETRALERVSEGAPETVVACGGGAVLSDRNWAAMRASGVVVCLRAPVEAILERTSREATRPLLEASTRRERVMALLREREPRYCLADACVESVGGVGETAGRVWAAYQQVAESRGQVG